MMMSSIPKAMTSFQDCAITTSIFTPWLRGARLSTAVRRLSGVQQNLLQHSMIHQGSMDGYAVSATSNRFPENSIESVSIVFTMLARSEFNTVAVLCGS